MRQVADRFHQAEGEFRARDGYTIESQVGAVLSGLGFPQRDWKRRTEEFSGGWQMRIALAKLLLEKPNLLLLDEPTNHLDLEARNWLEEYLAAYPNAFVLVSHDRYFLDVTVRKIVELWNKSLHFYTGGYTPLRSAERRAARAVAGRLRQPAGPHRSSWKPSSTASAPRPPRPNRCRAASRNWRRSNESRFRRKRRPSTSAFRSPSRAAGLWRSFSKVSKAYGDHVVFSGGDLIIERGDRVALVGVNGAGKSTMIKILAGAEPVTSGEYILGHNAQPDYFAQDQYKELDQSARMIDDLATVAPRATNTELRSILGSFLFSEDDVFKQIGVLSGGERNRYALARMLMVPSNFMLLDEPTNHLDMRAKDVLLKALQEYTGTVVFVSHDRYFIDKLATRVFEVEDGRVHVYPGNYEDYLWRKQGGGSAPASAGDSPAAVPVPVHSPVPAAAPAAIADASKAPATRLNPIKLRQMKERSRAIEDEITRLEVEIADYEAALGNFVNAEETKRMTELLEARRADLESLMTEWEEVAQLIEANS